MCVEPAVRRRRPRKHSCISFYHLQPKRSRSAAAVAASPPSRSSCESASIASTVSGRCGPSGSPCSVSLSSAAPSGCV